MRGTVGPGRWIAAALVVMVIAPVDGWATALMSGALVDGVPEDGSCDLHTASAPEIYVVNVARGSLGYTNWIYSKDEATVGNVAVDAPSPFYDFYPGTFSGRQSGTDRFFVFVTAPGADGEGDLIALDSTTHHAPNLSATTWQVVGETIAPSYVDHAGTGFVPGGPSPWTPDVFGSSSRAWLGKGPPSIDLVFGALIDHQPTLYYPGPNCGFGTAEPHFDHPDRGLVVGYNLFRQRDAGAEPIKESWAAAHWLGFIPVDEEPGDLARTVDLNGLPGDGDEYLLFSDADLPGVRDSPLPSPSEGCRRGYWYVIQPVVEGDYWDWTPEVELSHVPLGFDPKLPDGGIDLSGDGEPEFFSPQAIRAERPGLGLTVRGRPLVSAPVRGCLVDQLGANGRVTLPGGADERGSRQSEGRPVVDRGSERRDL
ncbi:MAG: hypothetical protein AAF533_00715 [Acidobacteriota bacterium]